MKMKMRTIPELLSDFLCPDRRIDSEDSADLKDSVDSEDFDDCVQAKQDSTGPKNLWSHLCLPCLHS